MSNCSSSGFTPQICGASCQRSCGTKEGLGSRELRYAMGVILHGVSGVSCVAVRDPIDQILSTGAWRWHTIGAENLRGGVLPADNIEKGDL